MTDDTFDFEEEARAIWERMGTRYHAHRLLIQKQLRRAHAAGRREGLEEAARGIYEREEQRHALGEATGRTKAPGGGDAQK